VYLGLSFNRGISFSLLSEQANFALAVAGGGIVFFALACAVSKNFRTTPGMILLWAGAAGNLTDRLFYGGVVDWIHVGGPGGKTLGSLNLADLWLMLGFLLFFVSSVKRTRTPDRE
jgi:signal peptidase II